MFVGFGVWSVFLGVRSWSGQSRRPSASVVFAGGTARVRRFMDRCIVPLGLFYVSFGATLGLASDAASLPNISARWILDVAAVVGAVASFACLALTICVYRYWKPRRLIPAYIRDDTGLGRSGDARADINRDGRR